MSKESEWLIAAITSPKLEPLADIYSIRLTQPGTGSERWELVYRITSDFIRDYRGDALVSTFETMERVMVKGTGELRRDREWTMQPEPS
jgi:hypothetical protein